MLEPKVTEGTVDFSVPGIEQPCKTWYKIFGDLENRTRRPLVALHGGPGATHHYLLSLAALTQTYSIPLILYDQLGNGSSTHLKDRNGDTEFWTVQLFIDELNNLLDQLGIRDDFDLLGQSWGGMLAAAYASQQPKGLRRLIIASSPASMPLWVEAQLRLRAKLPQDVQDALDKHEKNGTTEDKEYADAVQVYYENYLCRIKPFPEFLTASLSQIEADNTVYLTMNGPNEFYITGSLKEWTVVDEVHKITVPTLLLNGGYDEAQDSVMDPFFRSINKVKWVKFLESSHTAHLEETDRFIKTVGEFLI